MIAGPMDEQQRTVFEQAVRQANVDAKYALRKLAANPGDELYTQDLVPNENLARISEFPSTVGPFETRIKQAGLTICRKPDLEHMQLWGVTAEQAEIIIRVLGETASE